MIHDAETAGTFARELQLLLRTLGAGEANLEKGEMRIEANISVSSDPTKFGTKVEVKNLNSFRSVERAIAYEVERQSKLIAEGGRVDQETRGWDEAKQETFHQRFKEGSADYRYFPEPDLPKIMRSEVNGFDLETLRAGLPELPRERRARYAELGIKEANARALAASLRSGIFFDLVVTELASDTKALTLAANYLLTDLAGDPQTITPSAFAKTMMMVTHGELSSRGAKDLLALLAKGGEGDPLTLAKEHGLLQVHDEGALKEAVRAAIQANQSVAADYRGGKAAALQFLVGQAMKATKGAGNPGLLREILIEELR